MERNLKLACEKEDSALQRCMYRKKLLLQTSLQMYGYFLSFGLKIEGSNSENLGFLCSTHFKEK